MCNDVMVFRNVLITSLLIFSMHFVSVHNNEILCTREVHVLKYILVTRLFTKPTQNDGNLPSRTDAGIRRGDGVDLIVHRTIGNVLYGKRYRKRQYY